jgi:hypothetical protein
VYISGAFGGTIDFDPGAGVDEITPLDELYDVYLTKLNADGTYAYTKTIHGPVDEASHPITTDLDNNVYMAGYFYDVTVDFDPGAGTDEHTANGAYAFLTKLSSDGSYEYTKTFGGCEGDCTVIAESIKTDQENNVYLTGTLNDTADFDPGVGVDSHSSVSLVTSDTFLTKINADGTYGYTKTIGAESNNVRAGFVDIDQDNNVYLAGNFMYGNEGGNSTVDFDPGAGTDSIVSSANYDTFLTRINADGSYAYTKTIGGTSNDYIYSLAVDQLSNVYLSGRFDGTVDFDPTSGTDNKSATGDGGNAFLTKLTQTTYQQITGLPPTLAATTLSDTDATDNTIENGTSTTIRLSLGDTTPIADIETTFSADLDWSTVTAESDPDTGKAFVHNLTAADGTAGTYTLYVPKLAGDTRVGICPGASSLAAVTDTCTGLYYLTEGIDDNLATTTIDGQDYWAISGLTGTGGFSAAADNSDEALADTGSNQFLAVLMACGILMFSVMIRRNYGRA